MMKNKHYTYINTTKGTRVVRVQVALKDGTIQDTALVLQPGQIFNEQKVNVKFGNEVKNIIDVSISDSSGKFTSIQNQALGSVKEILKTSAILDIETTGRLGGDSIHQIAVYDVNEKQANLFLPSANLIVQDDVSGEGALTKTKGRRPVGTIFEVKDFRQAKLLETALDLAEKGDFSELDKSTKLVVKAARKAGRGVKSGSRSRMMQVLIDETNRKHLFGGKAKSQAFVSDLEDYMIKTDRFQALLFVQDEQKLIQAGIGVDRSVDPTVLTSETKAKRQIFQKIVSESANVTDFVESITRFSQKQATEAFKDGNKSVFLTKGSMRDILAKDLPSVLQGKVTWIANASFEAKQFGGQIDALADEAFNVLNKTRPAEDQVTRNTFMKRFQYGAYEAELEQINTKRSASGKPALLTKNPFFGVLEGVSATSGDPFYSTGLEYNKIRTEAFRTGDFSGLFKGLVEHTKAGDVRDIQDLVRAQQSMLKNMGLLDIEKPTALSVEVQSRLFGFTEELRKQEASGKPQDISGAIDALKVKESHIALGDVAYSESLILRESLDQLEALEKVQKGGSEADALIRQASKGEGAYFRALNYAALSNYFNKPFLKDGNVFEGLEDVLFKARQGRILMDLAETGSFESRKSVPGSRIVEQARMVQDVAEIKKIEAAPKSIRVVKSTYGDVVQELEDLIDYKNANKEEHLQNFEKDFSQYFDAKGNVIKSKKEELRLRALKMSESHGAQIKSIEDRIQKDLLGNDFLENLRRNAGLNISQSSVSVSGQTPEIVKRIRGTSKRITSPKKPIASALEASVPGGRPVADSTNSAKTVLEKISNKALTKGAGAFIGTAIALAGMSVNFSHSDKVESLLIGDFESFLEAQAQYYGSKEEYVKAAKAKFGMIDGLQNQGIAEMLRSSFTDFGSPYQGMGYSMSVLEDHNLRKERNKYVQEQFSLRHFSDEGDIGSFFNKFINSAFRKEMQLGISMPSIISGDYQRIDSQKYGSLRGKDLIEYDFSKFSVTAEDADTITVKRNGNADNALSAFMGTDANPAYKFRLAGIDSPETAHGNRNAQPFGEKAKEILKDMLENAKSVKVVAQKGESTYGRQVGMLYVDGKNVNLELVKRGAAAFLPYRSKGKTPMYQDKVFEEAQEFAQESKRGMWKEGYFQAYAEISKATGETTTFNTLADITKVAKNRNLMSLYSTMHRAQKEGGISESLLQEIQATSEQFKYAQKMSPVSIFRPDDKYSQPSRLDLQTFGYNTNSIMSSMDQIKYDLAGLVKNRQKTEKSIKKLEMRSKNNLSLVNESLNAAQVQKQEFVQRDTGQKLRQLRTQQRTFAMEELQQSAVQNLFNSPIHHHRM